MPRASNEERTDQIRIACCDVVLLPGDSCHLFCDPDCFWHAKSVTRDQELWAVALAIERGYGLEGWLHIAQEKDRMLAADDTAGFKMWSDVGQRFEQLIERNSAIQ